MAFEIFGLNSLAFRKVLKSSETNACDRQVMGKQKKLACLVAVIGKDSDCKRHQLSRHFMTGLPVNRFWLSHRSEEEKGQKQPEES